MDAPTVLVVTTLEEGLVVVVVEGVQPVEAIVHVALAGSAIATKKSRSQPVSNT